MCDFVQAEYEAHKKRGEGQTKIQIVVPRTFGKTENITEGLPSWVITKDKNATFLISNEKLDNANDFLGAIKKEVTGKVAGCHYPQVYWDWGKGATVWREEKIEIAGRTSGGHNPSILTTSVEVGRTSKHPEVITLDDPHNPETLSETTLESTHTHYKSLTQVLSPTGFFLIITTRYAPNDIVGFLDDKEGDPNGATKSHDVVVNGVKQGEIWQNGDWKRFFMLALADEGSDKERSTYPELYTLRALKKERDAHPALFACQKQNNPLEGEHAPLTIAQLDECWLDGSRIPANCRIYLHCDTAFKEDKTVLRGDYSTIIESRHDDTGNVYFTWAWRRRARQEEFGDQVCARIQYLRKHAKRVYGITYDKPIGGGGDNIGTFIRNVLHGAGLYAPVLLPLPRQGRNKERRIRYAAGYWADGRCFIMRGMPQSDVLRREMLMASQWDDMADAAADAFHDVVYKPQRNTKGQDEARTGWKSPSQQGAATGGNTWNTPFKKNVSSNQWVSLDPDNRFMVKGGTPNSSDRRNW